MPALSETSGYVRKCSATALLIVLLASLSSCNATGQPYRPGEPVAGKSSLYIYRVRAFTGSAFSWDVYLDEEKLTELRSGGYYYTTISPGSHTILVKIPQGLSLNVLTEPDQAYYYRLGVSTSFVEDRYVFERVPESLALDQLTNMKLQAGAGAK